MKALIFALVLVACAYASAETEADKDSLIEQLRGFITEFGRSISQGFQELQVIINKVFPHARGRADAIAQMTATDAEFIRQLITKDGKELGFLYRSQKESFRHFIVDIRDNVVEFGEDGMDDLGKVKFHLGKLLNDLVRGMNSTEITEECDSHCEALLKSTYHQMSDYLECDHVCNGIAEVVKSFNA